MRPSTPRTDAQKARPTLGNVERRAIAALIVSKLPGTTVDWTSGHGNLQISGKTFCTITREGDLSLYLPAERMEGLLGSGEARPMQFGKRVVSERIVIDATAAMANPGWALALLREARLYAETKKSRKST